jgi:hypothetical protein
MALTSSCRGDSGLKCEFDGTMTQRKQNQDCSRRCGCFEWTAEEGKPPTIPRRAVSRNTEKQKGKIQGNGEAEEEKAKAQAMEAASPFDFPDYQRKVPRKEVEDSAGQKSSSAEVSDQEEPEAIGHPGKPNLARRHNYALVCELEGVRDAHITRSCATGPRYYSCDRMGILSKRSYDSYCDQHCACQYMNTPVFRAGSGFWSAL